jgi:predicted Rossmann fold nucleotide-binding protein DprA/Smf involved in DNA uptake
MSMPKQSPDDEMRSLRVLEALEDGPLKAGTLAVVIGEKKGTQLNQLLYSMKKAGQVERNEGSPAIWKLAEER